MPASAVAASMTAAVSSCLLRSPAVSSSPALGRILDGILEPVKEQQKDAAYALRSFHKEAVVAVAIPMSVLFFLLGDRRLSRVLLSFGGRSLLILPMPIHVLLSGFARSLLGLGWRGLYRRLSRGYLSRVRAVISRLTFLSVWGAFVHI